MSFNLIQESLDKVINCVCNPIYQSKITYNQSDYFDHVFHTWNHQWHSTKLHHLLWAFQYYCIHVGGTFHGVLTSFHPWKFANTSVYIVCHVAMYTSINVTKDNQTSLLAFWVSNTICLIDKRLISIQTNI